MDVRLSAAVAVVLVAALACMSQVPITLEAERGTLDHLQVATTRSGFDGTGYVTGFTNANGDLRFTFDAPQAGIYDLQIRYSAPPDGKGYSLAVNDVGSDGRSPPSPDAFSIFDAGKVELVKGVNRLQIGRGWGYYDVDWLRLTPSIPYALPKPVPPTLSDPKASPEARTLMQRLVAAYGRSTLSGAISTGDAAYIRQTSGRTPAIMGGDLIDYTPSRREHGTDPNHETERLIAANRAGQIITLCWHWNAPRDLIDQKQFTMPSGDVIDASWYRGFYSNATRFDFTPAMADPKSEERRLLERDVDAIAVELKKLADAKVPVLWRPLHEADGKWFWWGARGPDQFKKLWRFVHDRLTVHHGLHNLIWVYTAGDPDWYPGDDVVDVVGIDSYPSHVNDTQSSVWNAMLHQFDGKKLIALTEFGGVPDVPRMQRLGVQWAWFASWSGPEGPQKIPPADLARIYQSPAVTNLAPTTRAIGDQR